IQAAASLRARARTWPSRLGDRGHGQLRCRPDDLPARAGRVGGRGRSACPPGAPQRRQVGRARRRPRRQRSTLPQAPRPTTTPPLHPPARALGWAPRVLLPARGAPFPPRKKPIEQLKGLSATAPDRLPHPPRKLTPDEQLARCARLRTSPSQSTEHRATIVAL